MHIVVLSHSEAKGIASQDICIVTDSFRYDDKGMMMEVSGFRSRMTDAKTAAAGKPLHPDRLKRPSGLRTLGDAVAAREKGRTQEELNRLKEERARLAEENEKIAKQQAADYFASEKSEFLIPLTSIAYIEKLF